MLLTPNELCAKAKSDHGGAAGLAEKLTKLNPTRALTRQAVVQWKQVPADRVIDVEVITGISRHELRPDVFGKSPERDEAAA